MREDCTLFQVMIQSKPAIVFKKAGIVDAIKDLQTPLLMWTATESPELYICITVINF